MVWKLGTMMCTNKEIADILGISENSVRKNFTNLLEQARSVGRRSLRRAQMTKAMEGDSRMLIFLGKQYLSQKDNPVDVVEETPLPWKDE